MLSDKNGRYRIPDLPAANYDLRIRAIGYKADPQNGVNLTANQSASHDFALQAGVVRWSDLTLYQGKQFLPKSERTAKTRSSRTALFATDFKHA